MDVQIVRGYLADGTRSIRLPVTIGRPPRGLQRSRDMRRRVAPRSARAIERAGTGKFHDQTRRSKGTSQSCGFCLLGYAIYQRIYRSLRQRAAGRLRANAVPCRYASKRFDPNLRISNATWYGRLGRHNRCASHRVPWAANPVACAVINRKMRIRERSPRRWPAALPRHSAVQPTHTPAHKAVP
jgi:hypothetical protein